MLTNTEFQAILDDPTKRFDGDIAWVEDEDHSPCREFRIEVQSEPGWPLFIRGSHNPLIPAFSFVLILKTVGRVYGLDIGKDHHNPQCDQVGETHKHRWTEQFRDKEAYVPSDITASVDDITGVWKQFCLEARLTHNGILHSPTTQEEFFL